MKILKNWFHSYQLNDLRQSFIWMRWLRTGSKSIQRTLKWLTRWYFCSLYLNDGNKNSKTLWWSHHWWAKQFNYFFFGLIHPIFDHITPKGILLGEHCTIFPCYFPGLTWYWIPEGGEAVISIVFEVLKLLFRELGLS